MRLLTRYLVVALFSFLGQSVLHAQDNIFFTLNNVKAQPLAMGGAFTAVKADLAAINYNPAAFTLYEEEPEKVVTFFLNTLSPFVGGIRADDLFSGKGSFADDVLISLSLLVKSLTISLDSFEVGVLLGEAGLKLPEQFRNDDFFRVAGYRQNHTHSFFGRLKLADRILIGASANLIYGSKPGNETESTGKVGINYGVLISPEQGFNIGVSLINLPGELQQFRVPIERIANESNNFGVSYQIDKTNTLFSVDVRNLAEEESEAVREVHAGFQQILLSNFALRSGLFRQKGENVYSFGVGILNSNLFNQSEGFVEDSFLLNYAFVLDTANSPNLSSHFLSFYFRL